MKNITQAAIYLSFGSYVVRDRDGLADALEHYKKGLQPTVNEYKINPKELPLSYPMLVTFDPDLEDFYYIRIKAESLSEVIERLQKDAQTFQAIEASISEPQSVAPLLVTPST